MIRIIDSSPKPVCEVTKPMFEMQPLEVCVVVSCKDYKDHVVMRTASNNSFEVMNLSTPNKDCCWRHDPNITVRELYPGETYTLELS